MAYKEVTSKLKPNFTFDVLQDNFFDLLDKFKKLGLKNKKPKRCSQELIEEKEKF